MPRAAIRDWYGRQMPGPERLLSYMANFMYDRLDERQQLQRRARFFEWIAGSVTEAMVTRIKTIGGEAVNTFSLGDIVGLALHNFDNTGLQVVSEVDANGRNIPGGHRWRAVGDSHLGTRGHDATRASISGCRDDGRDHDRVDGSQTRTMATAAVRASLADLERVRRVGAEIGSRPVSTAQKATAVKQALGGPIFAAKGFIPREDRTPSANVAMEADAGRAPLEWRWGQLGDVAYCAVDKTVKGQIAAELRVLACEVQDPVEGSLGVKIYGTRNAYRSFVQHLSADGIKAIETAVGKPAR